jgi:hypothetical protein
MEVGMNNTKNSDQPIDLLRSVARRHCSHIKKPYALKEICEQVEGNEYNAELMLQHLLLWCSDYMNLPSAKLVGKQAKKYNGLW